MSYLSWPVSTVVEHLDELDLGQYSAKFKENDISGAVLPLLTDAHLKELGIKVIGHRLKFMKFVNSLTSGSGRSAAPRQQQSEQEQQPQQPRQRQRAADPPRASPPSDDSSPPSSAQPNSSSSNGGGGSGGGGNGNGGGSTASNWEQKRRQLMMKKMQADKQPPQQQAKQQKQDEEPTSGRSSARLLSPEVIEEAPKIARQQKQQQQQQPQQQQQRQQQQQKKAPEPTKYEDEDDEDNDDDDDDYQPPPKRSNAPKGRPSNQNPPPSSNYDDDGNNNGNEDEDDGDRVPCAYCGRKFASDRIQKHEQICARMSSKKKRVFDAAKQRVQGTEAAQYIGKAKNNKQEAASKKPSKYKQEHEKLVEALRAARKIQDYEKAKSEGKAVGPPPALPKYEIEDDDRTPCPYCGRKFGGDAAQKHIAVCERMNGGRARGGGAAAGRRGKR